MQGMDGVISKVTAITILTVSLLSFSQSTASPNQTVCVTSQSNNTSSCRALDEALLTLQSNSLLLLEEGTHIVQSDYLVSGKVNVSIVGNPAAPSSVVIRCNDTYGLIFMGIQQLRMSGFTVTDCGFTGIDRVLSLFSSINNVARLFFHPLYLFSTGVLLFDIRDFVIEDAIIEKNVGFGMVAINLIGNSRILRVDFISNFPNARSVCNLEVTTAPGGSGGGLFLMYHDYINESRNDQAENTSLLIDGGTIRDNYNCRRDPYLTQFNLLTRSLAPSFSTNMSILGAGGITLSLGQTSYSIFAKFDNCTFMNNSGLSDSTALVVFLYNDTERTDVVIQNSVFEKNGGVFFNRSMPSFPEDGLDPFGALGVAFFIPLPESNVSNPALPPQFPDPARVVIRNCSFVENTALSGGGITVFSFSTTTGFINDTLLIQNCVFRNNTGNFGSAIFMTELSYSAFESALRLTIDSIVVQNNRPIGRSVHLTIPFLSDIFSAVAISNVQVNLKGKNVFAQNEMTAVSMSKAVLRISGLTEFTENSGVTGGALNVERESYVVLVNRTELVFTRNTAVVGGGAVYVNFRSIRANSFDCYLFLEKIDVYCDVTNSCPVPDNRFILKFFNNTAPLGSAVFGSNLFECPWRKNNSYINPLSVSEFTDLSSLDPNRFPIIYDPPASVGMMVVNTFPLIVTGQPPPENNSTVLYSTSLESEPGQQFSIPLSAYDRLGQPVPLTVFSQIDDPQATSIISTSNRLLLAGGEEKFTDVPFRIFGEQEQNYSVTITTNEALIRQEFTLFVAMKNCSKGFVYNSTTRDCDCEIEMYLKGVTCNNDGSISFPQNQWIGIDSRGYYIQGTCIRDFCNNSITSVNLSNPDSLCRNNRSGILCGECALHHSRVTGASFCDLCETNNHLALVILFIAFGILLVVILGLFNITITDGLINGFVFYANIFGVYTSTFLPVTQLRGTPALVLISFLNLHFGIKSCFYVGMTELELVGLTLMFPIYLMLILLVIVLVGKYVTHERVSHFYQQINVTHIFATLLFYCYASVMETCVAILAGLTVEINQAERFVRWGRDPNVKFGTGVHLVLLIISLLLLVVIIPLPIILLIPRISFRIRFLRNFKPVIDAFIAPFAPEKSFWISLRLVFRVLIFLIAAFGVATEQLVVISFFITTLTLVQAYLKPFSSSSRNIIDTFLMFNLTLFSIAAIYLIELPPAEEDSAMTFMFVFMYIFSIMLLVLFAHYLLKRFECTSKPYMNAIDLTQSSLKKVHAYFKNPYCCCTRKTEENESGINHGDRVEANFTFSNAVTHGSVNISDLESNNLRETLLEFEEERLTPKKRKTNDTTL